MDETAKTMLPPTSTSLTRALDLVEERLFSLPVQMINKDPATIDVGLLDHLAWEYSVDVWDPDWPEQVKRDVIAASVEVHRYKGTPHAIRTALGAFDVDTEFLEWFEPDGVAAGMERGSFRVTAYAGRSLYADTESAIDIRMVLAMNAVVLRVAPVSRKLIFRLGERFDSGVQISTGTRPRYTHSNVLEPIPRPAVTQVAADLTTGARQRRVFCIEHTPSPRPVELAFSTYAVTGLRARVVSYETHIVQRRASG